MIETCKGCGEQHETGNDNNWTMGGVVIKVCPNMPENMTFNPDLFKEFFRDVQGNLINGANPIVHIDANLIS